MRAGFVILAALLFCAVSSAQEIDGYTVVVVPDVAGDDLNIIPAIREEASSRGFIVYTSVAELPKDQADKAVATIVSWHVRALGGTLAVKLVDLLTLKEVAASSRDIVTWGTARGPVRRVTRLVFDGFGYRGYDAGAHERNMEALKLASSDEDRFTMSEADLVRYLDDNESSIEPIEGVWSTVSGGKQDSVYKLGIIRTPSAPTRSFTVFVLESNLPWWRIGDIKARFQGTASPDVFTADFLMGDKSSRRMSFASKQGVLLESITGADEPIVFVKNYPSGSAAPATPSTPREGTPGLTATGTGFVVGQNLVATNFHVTQAGKRFEFVTEQAGTFPLEVVAEDRANDLALLRLLPASDGRYPSFRALPIADASGRLGDSVYTIGYPLSTILGDSQRVTDGSISALAGIKSDPRFYQVSIPTQPGNSGGPVINQHGAVVGILTAQLNALAVMQASGTVAQNVNFAVKIQYLQPLIPAERKAKAYLVTTPGADRSDQIAILQKSVGQIRVYRP